MENVLHILNGDATLHGFNATGLDGDVMVWREVLSEGPLLPDVSSAEFWETRRQWISHTAQDAPDNYNHLVMAEIGRLNSPYTEYNLWFEFDLHCQVNLLAAMTLLQQKTDLDEPAFFLICPGAFPQKPNFGGMGELNGKELLYLYDNIRQPLTPFDFALAAEAWPAYTTQTIEAMQQFIQQTHFWGSMHLLKPALEAHMRRLTVNSSGLNYIQQCLVNLYNQGATTRAQLYQGFWATEKIYGMGDMSLDLYLQPLLQKKLIRL